VREQLAGWAAVLAAAERSLRPVRLESLHVTLCFLDNRPLSEVDMIGAACSAGVAGVAGVASAAGAPGPALPLATAGALGLPPRRPRLIAVRIDDRGGGLTRLQAAVSQALVEAGVFQPERRPFLPHVTVARARRGAHLRSMPDASLGSGSEQSLRSGSDALAPCDFVADTVTLYRSHPGPGGSVYEPLHSAVLKGSA
jgi:2'-5' RNA ligase